MPAGAKKAWQSALKKALADYSNQARGIQKGGALNAVAQEVVECAIDRRDPNFYSAVREIGLRLDGKPTEHIEINDSEGAAAAAIGISATFIKYLEVTNQAKIIDGEVIVQDRSVLPLEICPEPDGRGETMDISEDSGRSE